MLADGSAGGVSWLACGSIPVLEEGGPKMAKRSWYSYFKENMDKFPGGGLPCPDSLFASADKAVTTIATIGLALANAKKGATLAELAAAGTLGEAGAPLAQFAARAAGVLAAAYVGYALGSVGVATAAYIKGDNDAHYENDPPPDDRAGRCPAVPRDTPVRPGSVRCPNDPG
jgi:hypothetical protein